MNNNSTQYQNPALSAETEEICLTPDLTEVFNNIGGIVQLHRVPVMIIGETGVGKTHTAEKIHRHPQSRRKDSPFVVLNMATITEELAESQLFGHKKGAFTGATSDHLGAFQRAKGGTLFLDEIAELSKANQAKLLRALSERKFLPLGAKEEIEADVRIITATSKNLAQAVEDGKFRQDLYYRLNCLEIHIPPLRTRPNDIERLAIHFARKHAIDNDVDNKPLTPEAITYLQKGQWSGNVRELDTTIVRGLKNALSEKKKSDVIGVEQLAGEFDLSASSTPVFSPEQIREHFTKQFLSVPDQKTALDIGREAWKRVAFQAIIDCEYNCEAAGRKLRINPHDIRKLVTVNFDVSSTSQEIVQGLLKDWESEPHEFEDLVQDLVETGEKETIDNYVNMGWEAMIRKAMKEADGVISKASGALNVKRTTLNSALKSFNINPAEFKGHEADVAVNECG